MRKYLLWLALAALMLPPVAALANPGPPIAAENFKWVALGEIVPLMLETMLLRLLFGLRFVPAFIYSFWTNLISFIMGVVLAFTLVPLFIPHELMGLLSDLYFNFDTGMFQTHEMDLSWMAQVYFGEMAFLTLVCMGVETPIYYWFLRNAAQDDTRPSVLKIALVNLISYPVFYTLLFAGVLLTRPHV